MWSQYIPATSMDVEYLVDWEPPTSHSPEGRLNVLVGCGCVAHVWVTFFRRMTMSGLQSDSKIRYRWLRCAAHAKRRSPKSKTPGVASLLRSAEATSEPITSGGTANGTLRDWLLASDWNTS